MMDKHPQIAILYTTVGAFADAEKLAQHAVHSAYAACVNIIPNATSIYAWKETIEQSSECLMLFKTSLDRLHDLEKFIRSAHPYEVPAILICNAETSMQFYNYVCNHIDITASTPNNDCRNKKCK